MRADRLVYLILALMFAVSCGGGGGGGSSSSNPQPEEGGSTGGTSTGGTSGGSTGGSSAVDITYDKDLTTSERKALDSSLNAIAKYGIDGSKVKYFSQIFGGNNSSSVVKYLETRVNYALSESTDLNSRIAISAGVNALHAFEIFASNPSTPLWYFAKSSEPANVMFIINDKPVDITSSRIGVMQFGSLYSQSAPSVQAATLVHEARHSDCTGGATAADVERAGRGESPQNHECGHLHDICPPGHPAEGIAGCESLPWGAYIIDAIYSAAIMGACDTCSETDKQAAEINFNDVIQRPLYDIQKLLNGDFGPPDMSSSNQVR